MLSSICIVSLKNSTRILLVLILSNSSGLNTFANTSLVGSLSNSSFGSASKSILAPKNTYIVSVLSFFVSLFTLNI